MGFLSGQGPVADQFTFEPQYDYHDDVKYTFNGTLMIPVAGETERIEKEATAAAAERKSQLRVKMNFKDFVRLKANAETDARQEQSARGVLLRNAGTPIRQRDA